MFSPASRKRVFGKDAENDRLEAGAPTPRPNATLTLCDSVCEDGRRAPGNARS
jgi:hypothetical protein